MADEQKNERQKNIIELVKWFIGSVAVVISVALIDASFKGRELELKEVEKYNDYLEYIVTSDKVGERYAIANFNSIMAINEKIRERWKEYHEIVKKELNELEVRKAELENEIKKLATSENLRDSLKLKEAELQYIDEQIQLPPAFIKGKNISEKAAEYYQQKSINALAEGNLIEAEANIDKVIDLQPNDRNNIKIREKIATNLDQYKLASGVEKERIANEVTEEIVRDRTINPELRTMILSRRR